VSEGNISSWKAIRAGLDEYRPKELIIRLAELYKGRVPVRGRQQVGEMTRQVHELLLAHAGSWYHGSAGFRLYVPVPHSHHPYPAKTPGLTVWNHVRATLRIVEEAHTWLRSLDSLFRALNLPEDERERAAALAGAVRQVVALTGERMDWEDDWYNSADEPILWLLESQGITPTAELRQSVTAALSAFNSRAEPTPARARAVANEVAFAALREELNQRYSPPPG
jgi:hypothetical protein